MRYLTVSEVIKANESEVGQGLLADFGLLESAVLRPQQSLGDEDAYPDMDTKAAALMHSLVRNHAFVDGNKRTAVLAAIIFYNLNGYDLDVDDGALISLALDIAEGMDVPKIAAQLKDWVRPLEPPRE